MSGDLDDDGLRRNLQLEAAAHVRLQASLDEPAMSCQSRHPLMLESESLVSHEFVVAELACGSLKAREETLGYLKELNALPTVSTQEVLLLIETKEL